MKNSSEGSRQGAGKSRPIYLPHLKSILILMLLASKISAQDTIYEVVSSKPINLQEGSLTFLYSLKRNDPASSPGSFVYVRKTQTSTKAGVHVFFAIESPDFFMNKELEIDLQEGNAIVSKPGYTTENSMLVIPYKTAQNSNMHVVALLSSTSDEITVSSKSLSPASGVNTNYRRSITSDAQNSHIPQYTGRFVETDGSTRYLLRERTAQLDRIQAELTVTPAESLEFIDNYIKIEGFSFYFTRDGNIFKDDDNALQNAFAPPDKTSIASFQPKFITKYPSICSSSQCVVIASELRVPDNKHMLSYVKLQAVPSLSAMFQYNSIDLTDKGPLSMAIIMPETSRFIVFAGTKAYMYSITPIGFSPATGFVSPDLTGMVPGSLVPGALNLQKHPKRTAFMAMFSTQTGYTAKMFIYSSDTCQTYDPNVVCTKCVEGYRLTQSNSCESCSVGTCKSCPTNKDVCETCKSGYINKGQGCFQCGSIAPDAVEIDYRGQWNCVKTDAPPYNEGYREKQTAPYRVIEACGDIACKSCPADKDTCTECKDPSKGAINPATSKFDCSLDKPPEPEPKPKPEPESPGPTTPKPTEEVPKTLLPISNSVIVVRRDILKGLISLVFEILRTRPEYELTVVDLSAKQTYSCAQVGCSLDWVGSVLRLSFSSKVSVVRGELILTKKTAATALGRRLQTDAPDRVVVKDFVLHRDGWFFSWTTVAQLVLWFFRTFGSLVLFSYYPVTAMIVDQLVANCAVLSLYLGPSVTTADVVVQIIGRVQIVWYWFGNPFFGWDQTTLACVARPGHADEGLLCSFLDNYGSHTIGWAALSALVAVLYWTATRVLAAKPASAAVQRVCRSVQRDYGLKYVWARLDANQLEVMMYVLISYSLADSSSKSVVGLVLATIWMLVYLSVTVLSTVLLHSVWRQSAAGRSSSQPGRLTVAPLETEADQVLTHGPVHSQTRHIVPSARTNSQSQSQTKAGWLQSLQSLAETHVPFVTQNTVPITSAAQIFGPVIRLLRTFAVCILLLNHTDSSVAQLVVGIALETAYVGSQFWTRVEAVGVEFWAKTGLQGLVIFYLLLKAISTNSAMPDANRQGGLAVVMALVLLGAVLVSFAVMVVMTARVATAHCTETQAAPARQDGKQVSKQNPNKDGKRAPETVARPTTQIQYIPELGEVGQEHEVSARPSRADNYLDMDLPIPDEGDHHGEFKVKNAGVSQGIGLPATNSK